MRAPLFRIFFVVLAAFVLAPAIPAFAQSKTRLVVVSTLEVEHIVQLTQWLVAMANRWCEGRVVAALEGGYVPERVGAASVATMRAMLPRD